MSFVFISHAVADKPELRFLIDALIAAKVTVWMDNPAAMGFSEAEIDAHFIDLRGGRRWRDQIYEALEAAHCVLVCCSTTFVERFDIPRADGDDSTIKQEVTGARSKLVACRIDAMEFKRLPPAIREEYVIDLEGLSAGEERDRRVRRLIGDIRRVMEATKALHLRVQTKRRRRFGEFGPPAAEGPTRPLNDEQSRMMIAMMNRESAVQKLLSAPHAVMVSSGWPSARAIHLSTRLPFIELPLRTCVVKLKEFAAESDPKRLRVALVCGGIGETGRTWHAEPVAWPDFTEDAESAYSDFTASIIGALFGADALDRPADEATLASLLSASQKRYFVWSDLIDRRELRKFNEDLMHRVQAGFQHIDAKQFRLLIRVTAQSQPRGVARSEEWVTKRLCPSELFTARPIVLGEVGREQMIAWEGLASAITDTNHTKIADRIDDIYDGAAGMTFDKLEEAVTDWLEEWQLAPALAGKRRSRAPVGSWTDERN